MTWTQVKNAIYYGICLIVAIYAAIPQGSLQFIPVSWRPYVEGAVTVAAWVKSNWNLFINPDGSPAKVSYGGK
jgi:hypothetical protein